MVGSPLAEQFTVASPLSFSLLLPLITISLIGTVSSALLSCSFKSPNTFLNAKLLSLLDELTAIIGREPSPKEPFTYLCVFGIVTLRA